MGRPGECKVATPARRSWQRLALGEGFAHDRAKIGWNGAALDIEGYLDPRFEPVAEAFMEGFSAGRDVGAAVAVVVNGQLVVDAWHGHVDRRRSRPWQQDTLVCMFSVTKAITAVCLLQAVARGLVSLDDRVADHWPEFAAEGKGTVTVRHLLCHQAGLVGFHEPVSRDLLYDWSGFVDALARERLWWPPGERHGYHARTFGFLVGEVLRRCSGRSVGQWIEAELAQPMDLDFFVGLPEEALARCADVLPARVRAGEGKQTSPAMRAMMKEMADLSTPTGAAFQNPAMGPGYMNSREFRQAEIPAANGHGTARSVARLYDDLSSCIPAELLDEATSTHSLGPDEVLKSSTRFGLGFMLYLDEAPIGLRDGSFGHAGAGGSMAFHDPEAGLSFCFAMNQLEQGVVTGGTSATRVAEAVYQCL